jgi:hypothetical protein
VDSAVKPDLLAVGTSVYTAAESSNPGGEIYSRDGYADVDGTSFSSPLVAGAAALLKSARPGLSAAQYRSLLINSATPASLLPGTSATAQQAGAGVLDMSAAVRSTLAAAPVSLSFGVGGGDANVSRTLTLSNVGTARETYLISVLPRAGAPAPQLPGSVQLDPGASIDLPAAFTGAGLQPGAYEGTIVAQGSTSGVESHIPYWYAVGPGAAANIAVLFQQDQPRAGATVRDAVLFRVTDAAGVPLRDILPEVTVVSGGGTAGAVRSRNQFYPGVWSATVTFGPQRGANVFRVAVQDVIKDVTIVTR